MTRYLVRLKLTSQPVALVRDNGVAIVDPTLAKSTLPCLLAYKLKPSLLDTVEEIAAGEPIRGIPLEPADKTTPAYVAKAVQICAAALGLEATISPVERIYELQPQGQDTGGDTR